MRFPFVLMVTATCACQPVLVSDSPTMQDEVPPLLDGGSTEGQNTTPPCGGVVGLVTQIGTVQEGADLAQDINSVYLIQNQILFRLDKKNLDGDEVKGALSNTGLVVTRGGRLFYGSASKGIVEALPSGGVAELAGSQKSSGLQAPRHLAAFTIGLFVSGYSSKVGQHVVRMVVQEDVSWSTPSMWTFTATGSRVTWVEGGFIKSQTASVAPQGITWGEVEDVFLEPASVLASDDASLFWVGTAGQVRRSPHGKPSQEELGNLGELAPAVKWVAQGACLWGLSASGRLFRMPKSGGAPQEIVGMTTTDTPVLVSDFLATTEAVFLRTGSLLVRLPLP